jgi:hypothetical protein
MKKKRLFIFLEGGGMPLPAYVSTTTGAFVPSVPRVAFLLFKSLAFPTLSNGVQPLPTLSKAPGGRCLRQSVATLCKELLGKKIVYSAAWRRATRGLPLCIKNNPNQPLPRLPRSTWSHVARPSN